MKKTFTILFIVFLFSTRVAAQDNGSIQSIQVVPADTTVSVGDSIQFNSVVTDTGGTVIDSTVTWSVVGDVGTITENGKFTAMAAGSGYVAAQIGDISDSASVTVTAAEEPVAGGRVGSVEITPSSQTVSVGDSIQFNAEVKDTAGAEVDTTVIFSVGNTDIGAIDENGLFIAAAVGTTDVIASLGDIADTSVVIVTEEVPPVEPGLNTVEFIRVLPNGQSTRFGKSVTEGESKTLGGLPSPLNVLNGGKLEFPENSLVEDITLTIKLPGFAVVEDTNVTFGDSIVAAVTFEVSVNDSVISPYTFETPLVLTLPFKRGLLNNLGIDPMDLGMFFVTPSGALDSSGITDIVVDSSVNTITGTISHFSDVGIASKSSSQMPLRPVTSIPVGGGRIDLSNVPGLINLRLNRLFVDIPSGAVRASVNLQINVPTMVPVEKAALQAVEFTIEGHTGQFDFDTPVTIGIPYPETVTNEAALKVAEWDPTSEQWNPIDLVESIVADTAANIISAQVNHFSIYGVVEEEQITFVKEISAAAIPVNFDIFQNYPNPFNPETKIKYQLPKTTMAAVKIFNILGQEVRTLVDKEQQLGTYELIWNGKNNLGYPVSSGVYFYQLKTKDFIKTKKMMLIR